MYDFTATIKRLDSIPIGIESLLLFIYILYYFIQYIRQVDDKIIYEEPGFWILSGILFYLGGTFFFNILANNLNTRVITNYWPLTYIGDIIKNVMATIGIVIYLKSYKKTDSPDDNTKPPLPMPYLGMD